MCSLQMLFQKPEQDKATRAGPCTWQVSADAAAEAGAGGPPSAQCPVPSVAATRSHPVIHLKDQDCSVACSVFVKILNSLVIIAQGNEKKVKAVFLVRYNSKC